MLLTSMLHPRESLSPSVTVTVCPQFEVCIGSHRWRTDANRRPPATEAVRDRVSICEPVPTIEARPPADHAAALLGWLQGPGGRTGTIPATELEQMHWDVCHELGWEVVSWVAVGRELRRLLGAKKEYVRLEDGRRVRVYRVPPLCAARMKSMPNAA